MEIHSIYQTLTLFIITALWKPVYTDNRMVSRYVKRVNSGDSQKGVESISGNILSNFTVGTETECFAWCLQTAKCCSFQTSEAGGDGGVAGLNCLLFISSSLNPGTLVSTGDLYGDVKPVAYYSTVIAPSSISGLVCAAFCHTNYPGLIFMANLMYTYDITNPYQMVQECASLALARGYSVIGLAYQSYCFMGDDSVLSNLTPCGISSSCTGDMYGTGANVYFHRLLA